MEDGSDGEEMGVGVTEVFDDFVEPFEELGAAAGGLGGVGGFGVVEDDLGGAPGVVGDAAHFGACSEGFDADGVGIDGAVGGADAGGMEGGCEPLVDACGAKEFGAEGAEALFGLVLGGGDEEDVAFVGEGDVVEEEGKGDDGGFGGAAGGGDGEPEAGAAGEGFFCHQAMPVEEAVVESRRWEAHLLRQSEGGEEEGVFAGPDAEEGGVVAGVSLLEKIPELSLRAGLDRWGIVWRGKCHRTGPGRRAFA